MELYLYILFIQLYTFVYCDWTESRCTQVTNIAGTITFVNRQNLEVVLSTVINTQVAIGETLCFKLNQYKFDDGIDDISDALDISDLVYSLKLLDIEQVHPVTNGYDFAVPASKVEQHFCDCPCYADENLVKRNYCGGKPEPCVQIYQPDQTDYGCSGRAFCGDSTSETRMSFSVARDYDFPLFKAFEISTPITWLYFEVNVYEASSGQSFGKTMHIKYSLLDGAVESFDDRVEGSIGVTGAVETILTPKWYFRESSSPDMYTGLALNTKDEWDLDKLGWLKWRSGSHYYHGDNQALQDRFWFNYVNCENEEFRWGMSAKFSSHRYEKDTAMKELVQDKEAVQLKSVIAEDQQVRAGLRSSPQLAVFLQFFETPEVLFYNDLSKMEDFEVKLQLDKYSNTFLNISLQGSAGGILGVLKHSEDHHYISTYVDSSHPTDLTKYKGLPSSVRCNETDTYTICLRTHKQPQFHCKPVTVSCEKLQTFHVGDYDAKFAMPQHDSACSKFISYLNPVVWTSALSNDISDLYAWLGLIVNLLIVAVMLVLVGIIVIKCCGSSSSEKEKEYKVVATGLV